MNKNYSETLMGKDAMDALRRGIDAVFCPVSRTLGARGRNATYKYFGTPIITNDGVSIARRINPKDEFENLGASLVKQVAEHVNLEVGDGTTTSIVLAREILEAGIKELEKGENPMVLKAKIVAEKDRAIELLKAGSRPITTDDELLSVAKISVENEKIAKIVADSVKKAGIHGNVIVEEGSGYEIETEEVKGYFWDRGYVSPYMATNERMEAVLESPAVLVTDRYMNVNRELIPALDGMMKQGYSTFVVVVDRMEGELLQTLIVNKIKGKISIVVVKRPPSDEELEDLAVLVNGTAIVKDKGIREITSGHFGHAKRVIVTKDKTLLIADDSPARTERVKKLEEEMKENDSDELKSRVAKLTDGIVVLRVGAKTEAEMKYLKLKVDDAVLACKAAKEEGVVKGGGIALYSIGLKLIGTAVIAKALMEPTRKILSNAGMENKEVNVGVSFDGYDVLTQKGVTDMFEAGIIDPTKAERVALEAAVSLASSVLTCESVIVEKKEDPVTPLSK